MKLAKIFKTKNIEVIDIEDIEEIKAKISLNDVFLLDTDTIIGLSCSSYSPEAILKLNNLKKRTENKKYIHLVNSIKMVESFCELSTFQKEIIKKNWPNSITFIFLNKKKEKMLFRWPNDLNLENLIKSLGPIITTSANISGKTTPKNFLEVENFIKKHVRFYLRNQCLQQALPSTVIDLSKNKIEIIRNGFYQIKK